MTIFRDPICWLVLGLLFIALALINHYCPIEDTSGLKLRNK